jgi:hypothetical protein
VRLDYVACRIVNVNLSVCERRKSLTISAKPDGVGGACQQWILPRRTTLGTLIAPLLAVRCIARLGYFVICKNSIGAPASSMKATRTPSDGSFGLIITFLPRMAASRSSTSNATCETVFTKSGNGSRHQISSTAPHTAWQDGHLMCILNFGKYIAPSKSFFVGIPQ